MRTVASVSQVKHGVTWIVVQQLDKLEEDGAGLALGEYVGNHDGAFGMIDRDAAPQDVVLEEFGGA